MWCEALLQTATRNTPRFPPRTAQEEEEDRERDADDECKCAEDDGDDHANIEVRLQRI